jgi:hypothetical protein
VAKLLTQEEAARAIYFDFEGCVGQAPSLLGWSCELADGTEQFSQWIVEGALRSATRTVPHTGGAGRCGRATLDEAVAWLVSLAEEDDRRVVSWARFDLNVIESHVGDPELVERARARFMNALPTARQWLKRAHPQLRLERTRSGKHRLCRYCEIMAIRVPKKYDQDVAAKGIRVTRAAIARYGSYAAIPRGSGARGSWKAVLGHNRLDCRNAREVVTRSSST